MRFSDTPPLTSDGFESVLAEAGRGTIITDLGVGDAVWDALMRVAEAAPDPSPELLDAARAAFNGQRPA